MTMQDMETRYELSRAATPMDRMALNATLEPRLMSESKAAIMNEVKIAFNGMSQPGRT